MVSLAPSSLFGLGLPSPASNTNRSPASGEAGASEAAANAARSRISSFQVEIVSTIQNQFDSIGNSRVPNALFTLLFNTTFAFSIARNVLLYPMVVDFRRQVCAPLLLTVAGAPVMFGSLSAAMFCVEIASSFAMDLYSMLLFQPKSLGAVYKYIFGTAVEYPLCRSSILLSLSGSSMRKALQPNSSAVWYTFSSPFAFCTVTLRSSTILLGLLAFRHLDDIIGSLASEMISKYAFIVKPLPEKPQPAPSQIPTDEPHPALSRTISIASLSSIEDGDVVAEASQSQHQHQHQHQHQPQQRQRQSKQTQEAKQSASNNAIADQPTLPWFYRSYVVVRLGNLVSRNITLPLQGILVHMIVQQAVGHTRNTSLLEFFSSAGASVMTVPVWQSIARNAFVDVFIELVSLEITWWVFKRAHKFICDSEAERKSKRAGAATRNPRK